MNVQQSGAGTPTASETIRWQLAVTFSLTRNHHRAYGPPAVSFSCLDIEGNEFERSYSETGISLK